MPRKELIKDPEKILLSDQDEIQQVLGHPPGWMLRWGISVVFVVIALFFLLAGVVKYPDVVVAPVQITTENPPVLLVSRVEGRVIKLLVEDKESVIKNQLLAEVESTTNGEEADQLEKKLNEVFQGEDVEYVGSMELPNLNELGILQDKYAELKSSLQRMQHFRERNNAGRKIASMQKQLVHLKELNELLQKQSSTLKEELSVAEKSFQKFLKLNKNGAASQLELEEAQKEYLSYQRAFEKQQSDLVNNNLAADRLDLEILELSQQAVDQKNELYLNYLENARKLKADLEGWKQDYQFFSPFEGLVSMEGIWSEGQFIAAGQEIMKVIPPEGSGEILAIASLPAFRSGKVETGMEARLRLDGYPYKEYGVLPGKVDKIALTPASQPTQSGSYRLFIMLPEQMKTTYGKELEFRQQMMGQAHIITHKRSLLTRVFDKILHWKNNI